MADHAPEHPPRIQGAIPNEDGMVACLDCGGLVNPKTSRHESEPGPIRTELAQFEFDAKYTPNL